MRTISLLFALLIIGLLALSFAACDDDSDTSEPTDYQIKERSRIKAQDFVRQSPTFMFDGIESSLKQIESAQPAGINSWRFQFEFDSEHPGYGDRQKENLVEEVTRHEAEITVVDGEEITRAVIDNEWDMIDQKDIDDWEWSDAGKQAVYGVVSVFVVLLLLTLLTMFASSVIRKMETIPNPDNGKGQH